MSPLTCPQVCAAALTTTTTSTSSPGKDADAIILTCIAQSPPTPGCSYTGQGGFGSPFTCATICPMAPPPISAPCDPSAGSHVEQCLCVVGSPSNVCSYLASRSSSPLTCPQVCANPTVKSTATTTTTVSSANTNIESCIAAGQVRAVLSMEEVLKVRHCLVLRFVRPIRPLTDLVI